MDQSRKLDWHGFVDSAECFLKPFKDLAELKWSLQFQRSRSNSTEHEHVDVLVLAMSDNDA
jgi:hypothetical protein